MNTTIDTTTKIRRARKKARRTGTAPVYTITSGQGARGTRKRADERPVWVCLRVSGDAWVAYPRVRARSPEAAARRVGGHEVWVRPTRGQARYIVVEGRVT